MGTILSVAGWAIVESKTAVESKAAVVGAAIIRAAAVQPAMWRSVTVAAVAVAVAAVTSGCSTDPEPTDAAGEKVTTAKNSSETAPSYVPEGAPSEDTSGAVADAQASEASDGSDSGTPAAADADADAAVALVSSNTPSSETASASGFADAGASTIAPSASSVALETETSPANGTSETFTESTCRETAGLCDPVGDCALSDCDFENTGKSCGYTPDRTYPFMCVGNANYAPYRPCDSDDVCAPGSVCISKSTWLKDGSFYRRSATICRETCRLDADCGEGGWCAQATDDDNEVIPDLRVCHRHCRSKADCYVGEGDKDVRCSNSIENAPPSGDECSRYNPPAPVESVAEATDGVAQSTPAVNEPTTASNLSTGAGLTSALSLRVLHLQTDVPQTDVSGVDVPRTDVLKCGLDDDCPDDDKCINNTCFKRCESSAECAGAECVVVNGGGACGATCEKPEGAACGLWPSNCGCDTGETCHLGADFEPTCAKPGPNGAMSWCNKAADCDTGLSCIAGLCRPLCDPEAHPCSAVHGECLLSVSRERGDVYACAGSCDPVSAPDCGEGAVCLPGFDSEHHHQALCVAERAAQRPRKRGEACREDYDCATGLGCAATAGGTCQSWCRERADCPAEQTCKFDASSMGSTFRRFGGSVSDVIGLCQPL